ncbi:helix-turn-helix transcriptional regulator [Actinokineospora xionganensis]|uniref:LuxR family transcriptional regulator n=1 Tax=Actinokineospora xionganensis TaxID=2684470 RepID=A0ABR7KZA5_9PSEU|nr:LuxR family transcriptional regulator [Actinokineospora xionganensis]MBC6445768.1 LuxR family transcriptional regulator [Actinokineospora xionganensis]
MAFPYARDAELARIRLLVRAVRAGRGDAMVVVGGPGSGRTTLLDAAQTIATGVHVLRVAGVPSEKDEPADRLRDLADLAADHPVLCLVDDAQWLDAAGLAMLGRLARRCAGQGLGLLFAVPGPGWAELSGVEQLALPAAPDALPADLPTAVRTALIEATSGAPGHLAAMAVSLTAAQRAGHAPVPNLLPRVHRASLGALFTGLGPAARSVAVLCACEPLPLDAVDRVGLDRAAVAECVRFGLVTVDGDHVRCPSPVVAATLLADIPGPERAAAHTTLADVFDHDPRAIWHRFAEARPPDAAAAGALAEAGRRAHAAGEFPVAVRVLSRAAELSPTPATAARLHLAAADAAWSGGRATQAEALLARARAEDPALAGETALRQGEIALRAGHPAVAAHQLAIAADHLAGDDRGLQALILAGEARRMAGDLVGYAAVAERVAADVVADPLVARHFAAMAATFAGRHPAAGLALRRAAMAVPAHDTRHALWSGEAAMIIGQVDLAHEHASAAVARARSAGERTLLPVALAALAMTTLVLDRPAAATAVATEGRAAAIAAGQSNSEVEQLTLLALAAVSAGDCATALTWLALAAPGIAERGLGRSGTYAAWARGCVDLAEDRPEEAFGRLRAMATGVGRAHPAIRVLATPQLVEAAVRCGRADQARRALARFDRWAESTGAPTWLAFSRRCHALLEPEAAAEHFEAAIRLHLAAGSTLELGRTRLLYARHLRRGRQARSAREQLRDALRLFDNTPHWAERARAELRAAGDVGSARLVGSGEELTPQQEVIARLVAQGRTNREIAARLVISHRTVDHHLRNVFLRLGVRSRVELAAVYAGHDRNRIAVDGRGG